MNKSCAPPVTDMGLRATTENLVIARIVIVPASQPRPMNGIFVAMIVMNWTFASRGRLAM